MIRRNNFLLVFATLFTLTSQAARAALIEGVTFAESVNVGKEQLTLNGTGLRTATIFKVKVYAAGLYLKAKTTEDETALQSTTPKQLQMEFLRNVEASSIREAFDKGFKDNCESDCESLPPLIEKLKTLISDVKTGDRLTYTFNGDSVEIALNGVKKGEVSGKGFSKALLSTWLGKTPPTGKLKDGLLGKS